MNDNLSHVSKTMDKLSSTVSVTIAQLRDRSSPTKVVKAQNLEEEDCAEVSSEKGASTKETPSRHFSSTRYPEAASEVNAESPRGFTGRENLAKTGVTINPHVSSRSAKEMGDETPIQGDAQMYATMDPAAFQTIMD